MLIEFSVANCLSFDERQTLSMVKSHSDELPNNAYSVEKAKDLHLLHSVAIYGANASGKSNFIKAFHLMEQIVTTTSQRGDELDVKPFKLNQKNITAPSEFEVVFVIDGVRYQYGFSADKYQIYDEWLYAYPKNRPQKWFERVWVNDEKRHTWQFSSLFLGNKRLWQESTRDNALFLSTAVQLNSEQLKPLFDWFDKTLAFIGVDGLSPSYTAQLCTKEQKNEIIRLLRTADFNIHDIKVQIEDFDESKLPDDMPSELKNHLVKALKGTKQIDSIELLHYDDLGNPVYFDFDEESDGTQKFFAFSGPILDILMNGRILFIDELNQNLHPKLVQFLVDLFHNPKSNPRHAQLIFTTHETSILNQNVFRRDQIWFCERNKQQSSILYPLSDFSPKKGKENLENVYLSGGYGAVPFIDHFILEQ
ncbi:AAA family ATPase [Mannheimia varigena]|uniref:AAA family ATPase n=1 Tax=Mannheimia varigena TaxID=85404 RepID=UPI0003E32432|nr:ATP-binding protein [Mannheimia varigena]AHG77819.1 RloA protein [Mannheimia varigena USDA-ARS-USMARC-1312]